tara:strand:+ start:525 stop:959 length:435 start_codon:yes stop_codon:yes gene_type:complete
MKIGTTKHTRGAVSAAIAAVLVIAAGQAAAQAVHDPGRSLSQEDLELCRRADTSIAKILLADDGSPIKPYREVFVHMAQQIRGALECPTATKTCDLVGRTLKADVVQMKAGRKDVGDVIFVTGLAGSFGCSMRDLVETLEESVP